MDYKAEYSRWLGNTDDAELLAELKAMNEAQREDAFYRELAFGTGGLRGVIGAGTNRMNIYVVRKASQGLADYINRLDMGHSVVIGYDTRNKSVEFAYAAASVFAANGLTVYLWSEPLPVPTVSYAVRKLNASHGVMITASHNPAKYNGYKVYGSDGCQITTQAAGEILEHINMLDVFTDVKRVDVKEALSSGQIRYIDQTIYTSFIEEVKEQSVLFGDKINKDVKIVYSPLNGTGLKPVTQALEESGFAGITLVKEQQNPDGNFPTCPYPNPEIREALELGLQYCRNVGADLLLATDPDCDRCGTAVRDASGEYRLLTGNEVGILLLDYICRQRSSHGKMPSDPVFIKTIVTMDLAEKIAAHYGVRVINVLTGFKFIGEQIGMLKDERDYICGFEESYGYLTGSYVRDKDAVNAAFMICEMFAYYQTRGVSLIDKLDELYRTYGCCLNTLHSFEFDGSAGMRKMQALMRRFRMGLAAVGGEKVENVEDYIGGIKGLPPSDVLKIYIRSGSVVIRPSGTEPKLKIYISVTADQHTQAQKKEKIIIDDLMQYIDD